MSAHHLLAILCLTLFGCPNGGVAPKDDTGPRDSTLDDTAPQDTGQPRYGEDLLYADVKLVGEAEADYAGLSCRAVGDLDGDARDEILVGAPGAEGAAHDAGRAYLVLGAHLRGQGAVFLAEADVILDGEAMGDGAGGEVAAVGDVSGDGVADLLVAAYENDDGAGNAGKVYLLQGAGLGSGALADAGWIFVGESGSYQLGVSLAGGGDLNGDGLNDFAIGALGADLRGYLHVVWGSRLGSGTVPASMSNHILPGEGEGDSAGISSDFAGDIDGDGLDDLVIGAFGRDAAGETSGGAYLVLASDLDAVAAGDLGLASHRFTGQSQGDAAGFAVAGAGDVDGDGLADVLVGADAADPAGELSGKAYLILGGNLGETSAGSLALADTQLLGETAGDRAGGAVDGAGDVDGDGRGDVLIGACYNGQGSDNEGKAYLVPGSMMVLGGNVELAQVQSAWLGISMGDLAGRSVAGGGDFDDDGIPDLLIGATHANETGDNDVGKVFVLYGGGL
jgi:hypothetical protein